MQDIVRRIQEANPMALTYIHIEESDCYILLYSGHVAIKVEAGLIGIINSSKTPYTDKELENQEDFLLTLAQLPPIRVFDISDDLEEILGFCMEETLAAMEAVSSSIDEEEVEIEHVFDDKEDIAIFCAGKKVDYYTIGLEHNGILITAKKVSDAADRIPDDLGYPAYIELVCSSVLKGQEADKNESYLEAVKEEFESIILSDITDEDRTLFKALLEAYLS